MVKCQEAGCKKRAVWGQQPKTPLRCRKHKNSDDIDALAKRCEYEGCTTLPSFGPEGSKGRRSRSHAVRCATHKLDTDVNCMKPTCITEGCKTRPVFGVGDKPTDAVHCAKHKTDEEFDLVSPKCTACNKQPSFGTQRGKKYAKHCADHREEGEFNVFSRQCIADNCDHQPSYGKKIGNNNAVHCFAHMAPDEFYCLGHKCEVERCKKKPHYGETNRDRGYRCAGHKKDDDVDHRTYFCRVSKCKGQALYSGPKSKRAFRCDDHKNPHDILHKFSNMSLNTSTDSSSESTTKFSSNTIIIRGEITEIYNDNPFTKSTSPDRTRLIQLTGCIVNGDQEGPIWIQGCKRVNSYKLGSRIQLSGRYCTYKIHGKKMRGLKFPYRDITTW